MPDETGSGAGQRIVLLVRGPSPCDQTFMRRWDHIRARSSLLAGAVVAQLVVPATALAEVSDKMPGYTGLLLGFVVTSVLCLGAWRWHRVVGAVAFLTTGLFHAGLVLELTDPLIGPQWVNEVGDELVWVSVVGIVTWLVVNGWGAFRARRRH